MKSQRTYMLVLALAAAILCGLSLAGCTSDQLGQAQTAVTQLRAGYAATTQQVAELQGELQTASGQLAQAKAAAATQPAGTQAAAAIGAVQAKVDQVSAAITAAQSKETQILAGINAAQQLITAMQTGSTPNFSGLGAFGSYGALAGLVLSLGFSVYQSVKNGPALAAIQHVQQVTGTDSPTAAASAAHAAVTAVEKTGAA